MAYYRDTPLVTGDSPQLWFLDPDMAYAFPTDDGLTMLACVPHKDRIPEFKADPEAAMARMYERVPDGPRLDPAKRESKVLGKLDAPNERRRRPATGSRWSATRRSRPTRSGGSGCGWAFQSGEWLAEEVGPALGDEAELDRALKRYARRHRKALAGHNRVAPTYSDGHRFKPGGAALLPRRGPQRGAGRALRALRRALDQADRAADPEHPRADRQGEPQPQRAAAGPRGARRAA